MGVTIQREMEAIEKRLGFLATVGDQFEMDAVLLPVGAEGRQGTCYSGNQHMINSKTAHPEEAWELLKLYSSGEAGVCRGGGCWGGGGWGDGGEAADDSEYGGWGVGGRG